MAKKKSKVKKKRRMLLLGLTSVFIIVAMTFTIGKYWVEIYEKYQEKKELEEELVTLKEKEEELKVDADKLQDPDYIARYAREKYSYSKDGEFIIKIPER
jgi:cell division protein DivIC